VAKPMDWRDRAAAELAAKAVRRVRPSGLATLLVGERQEAPAEALAAEGAIVTRWDRRVYGGRPASARPSPGPYDLILLRLPRSKPELDMTAQMLTGVAAPGANLLLYGAKDEGIGSAPARLEGHFVSGGALEIGGHCRVWRLQPRAKPEVPARTELTDWALHFDPGIGGLSVDWVSYPGVFAHGDLDAGTRLLAESLEKVQGVRRVLDFGTGTGVLGALHQAAVDHAEVDLLDSDAIALEACRRNVPGANVLLGEGLSGVEGRTYDRIVTNPPIHLGKAETLDIVSELISEAPGVLSKRGSLWLVIQKRFALAQPLGESFRDVDVRAEDATFRVWEAARPVHRRGVPRGRKTR